MMLSRTHTVVPQTQQHQQHTYTRQQQQQLYSQPQPQPIDFDADQSASYTNPPSLSSSPSSTTSHHLYALASQPAIPFDTSSLSIPRRNQQIPTSSAPATASLDSFSAGLSQPPELMPSDSWPLAQYTPQKSLGRVSHHRESSLSSLGSAGPASPYSHNTSNPHIAVDPAGDGFNDGGNQYFDLVKSLGAQDGNMYTGYHNLGGLDQQDMGYHSAIGFQQKPRGDKNLLPADFPPVQNRSHPASVASSSVGGDSPATPTLNESEDSNKRRKLNSALHEPPKLGRTMTDIYSDELYNPNFSITSATSPHQNQMAVSPPNSDVFAQRLHAANSQHLSAAQSPASSSVSRDRSPFRHDSPMSRNAQPDFNALQSSRFTFNSAHQMREQEKAQQDARMMRQHMVSQKPGQDTPKTISPKEAMLEFHGADDSFAPLFPQQEATFGMDQMAKVTPPHDQLSLFQRPASQQPTDAAFNFMPQLSGNMHIPQHYPFIAHPRQHQDSPMHMSSTSSSGSSAGTPVSLQKPLGANADGGTYTCTYHGCTLRFETPALLQKHKREGHRQPQGLAGGPHRPDPATITAGMLNTQAGPHRCDRINPSTGKSCNTVFSRPYDLTRHEDTIHNARKQKVRCNLCTEEKTFSRADALTRHYRVCHPDVEFPGKYRRRGNHV